jgi:hypothetical protein
LLEQEDNQAWQPAVFLLPIIRIVEHSFDVP